MPDTIGRYTILEHIGSGALGELYRGRDTRVGHTVALILASADIAADPARRASFLADAGAASRLSHPNIAAIYDAGIENERLFLAAEFIAGQPLARLVASHPLTARRTIAYAIQVADALADAHGAGLTHGALTAATIVITAKDSVKILNYGLSAWTGDRSSTDEAGDLEGLGRVIVQMLTAHVPERGRPSPAPGSIDRRAPPALHRLVAKLLASSGDRYPSAAAVAAELRAMAATLDAEHEPESVAAIVGHQAGRSLTTWMVLLAAAVLLIVLMWAVFSTSRG